MNKTIKSKSLKRVGRNRPKKRNRRLQQAIRNQKKQDVQRSETLRAYLLLGILAVAILLFFWHFHTRRVSGESMLPTLTENDRLLVQKSQNFARYDLITFEPSDQSGESYVKRIVGMPGDPLQLKGNYLYLHGSKQRQKSDEMVPDGTLIIQISPDAVTSFQTLSEIPMNQYFVLGDNRNNSRDSREMGLIDGKQIEGIVVFRYFPLNKLGRVR